MALTDTQKLWLKDDTHKIILLEAEYHDGTSINMFYASTFPYITDNDVTVQDSQGNILKNIPYIDVLSDIPSITSKIDSSFSVGQFNILNSTGAFDDFIIHAWEGHNVRVFIGDPIWSRDLFIQIFEGKSTTLIAPQQHLLSLGVRDKLENLNISAQPDTINDTYVQNILDSASFSADIIDTTGGSTFRVYDNTTKVIPEASLNSPIPILLGRCFNISPVLIDSWNHVYVICEGAVTAIPEVRSNGVLLTLGDEYEVDITYGAIRLLVHDQGTQITCNAQGTTTRGTGYDTGITILEHTTAFIVEWLILEKTNLTKDDIDSINFENYSAIVLGLYLDSETTVLDTINQVMPSLGGFARFDRINNKFQILKFIDPDGETPILFLDSDDILEKKLTLSVVEPPNSAISLGYLKNWTVQDKDGLAGIIQAYANRTPPVDLELEIFNSYVTEYKILKIKNTEIVTQFPLAKERELIPTLIHGSINAQAELDRRAVLRTKKRCIYTIETTAAPFTLSVGDIINITHPRYEFTNGKNALIIGMTEKPTQRRITLEVWI